MFKSIKNAKSSKNNRRDANRKFSPSIIAGDMDILGNLISDGTVDIDGRVQGNVKAEKVIIRQDGRVLGDVAGEIVHIYGQVKGLVKARDVHLYASCKVEGTIMHELLSIEDGAFVDGKFKRTDKAIGERNRVTSGMDADDAPLVEEEDTAINLLQNLRLISKE